jgi:hypothetical protein
MPVNEGVSHSLGYHCRSRSDRSIHLTSHLQKTFSSKSNTEFRSLSEFAFVAEDQSRHQAEKQ